MNKVALLSVFSLFLLCSSVVAQTCCNVISGGIAVVSSNGICVVNSGSGGCIEEDSDGDGFADAVDPCPSEAGMNNGCPELMEEEKAVLAAALEGVKFKTDSDELLPESLPKLDAVLKLMQKHPDFDLKISGYTDNSGEASYNLSLSDKRAHAAEKYLLSKGISATRIMAKGYGEENPVATNETKEGRAKNRRVEFDLMVEN
ncbi:MAG: OmpA family protein [Bacteroidota bacterium]